MQYSSRIHILVKSKDAWKKLSRIKIEKYHMPYGFTNEYCCKTNGSIMSFCCDGGWDTGDNEVDSLAWKVFDIIGKKCIIIGDCTNISVDTNSYYVCAFGEEIHEGDYCCLQDKEYLNAGRDEEFMKSLDEDPEKERDFYDGKGKMWGMTSYANIRNVAEWLSYCGHFDFLSQKELEFLKEFGIVQVKDEKGTRYIMS